MRIWHLGAAYTPMTTLGLSNALWLLAGEQAAAGHKVSVVLEAHPDASALDFAQKTGLETLFIPSNRLLFANAPLEAALNRTQPDIVHMHSVFIPRQAFLARNLRRIGVPYIVKPGGGFAPQSLVRRKLKKKIYAAILERTRVRRSAAIALVTPEEEHHVQAFLRVYHGIRRWIPNPVGLCRDNYVAPKPPKEIPQIVFLGRFDVVGKGIDILIEIARQVPEACFHLYGTPEASSADALTRLRANAPQNVHFHGPVYGDQKLTILRNATLLIQPSRWEAFGNSIVEAMALGVPCAVSETYGLLPILGGRKSCVVLPLDPSEAAGIFREALNDINEIRARARRAQKFVCANFSPRRSCERYLELYNDVLESNEHIGQ